jgi:hypothetical protein
MTLDPRRRQKKIERKKAKEKDRKQDAVRRDKLLAARETALIAVSPIHTCRIQNCLSSEGVAQAILVRELPDHRLATAVILIDAYCLGIKDSFYKILTHAEYRELMDGLENSGTTRAIEPAALKQLIDGAIAYARQWGFEPHRDYSKAEFLLQAIDTSTCHEEFEYGRDGKPFYICGPHDSLDRQRGIVATLRRTCGDGMFHYVTRFGETRSANDDLELLRDVESQIMQGLDLHLRATESDADLELRGDVFRDEIYLGDELEDDDELLADDVLEAKFSDAFNKPIIKE